MAVASAKGSELRHWIEQANQQAGRRVLIKSRRVDELRRRLTEHYGLDVKAGAVAASVTQADLPIAHPSPPDIAADIQQRQWEHLISLGKEWAAAGDSFQLCLEPGEQYDDVLHHLFCSFLSFCSQASTNLLLHPSLGQGLLGMISALTSSAAETAWGTAGPISLPATCGPETVHALLQAAQLGDRDALATLVSLSSGSGMTLPLKTVAPPPLLPKASDSPPPGPSTCANDAAILASGNLEVEALERASGLIDALDQLERGDVKHMRDKYGPQPGRPHNPLWAKIKVSVSRRERLHHQLNDPKEFNGDKLRFLDFFASAPRRPSKHTRKGKGKAEGGQYPPFRLLVEAIPHRDHDIAEEKAKPHYQGQDGSFSEMAWVGAWQGANDWEIWRKLKKEHY